MSVSIPVSMPTNETQPNDSTGVQAPSPSQLQVQLESFGVFSGLYAILILGVGLILHSAKHAGHLIAYWGCSTASTWFLTLLGSFSAQGHGRYVLGWRILLAALFVIQVYVGLAFLSNHFSTSYVGVAQLY